MGETLREAAQAVVSESEEDDDFEGQFMDYLVPAAALDALRAALAKPSVDLDVELVTALLGEVGFMRSCIASGEKLNQADLDRQNSVMARAVSRLRDAQSTPEEYHEHVAGDRHAHPFNGPHSHGGVSALRSTPE